MLLKKVKREKEKKVLFNPDDLRKSGILVTRRKMQAKCAKNNKNKEDAVLKYLSILL